MQRPQALRVIDAMRGFYPKVMQAASFDAAFHATDSDLPSGTRSIAAHPGIPVAPRSDMSDPWVILHLPTPSRMSRDQVETMPHHHSGLPDLPGISADASPVMALAIPTDQKSVIAHEAFVLRNTI